MGGDPRLLLALSEGHGLAGLAPEKRWSGTAGPWLEKALSVSLTFHAAAASGCRATSLELPSPATRGSCAASTRLLGWRWAQAGRDQTEASLPPPLRALRAPPPGGRALEPSVQGPWPACLIPVQTHQALVPPSPFGPTHPNSLCFRIYILY